MKSKLSKVRQAGNRAALSRRCRLVASRPSTSSCTRWAKKSRYEGSSCRASSFISSSLSRICRSFNLFRFCSRVSRSAMPILRIIALPPSSGSRPDHAARPAHSGLRGGVAVYGLGSPADSPAPPPGVEECA